MIKEFRHNYVIELPVQVLELVAFRIQTGTRPLHRRQQDRLFLQDRWQMQIIYRRLGIHQKGLNIIDKTVIFEADCDWQKDFPDSVQIEYLRRPYCTSYNIEKIGLELTLLHMTLMVPIEIDLDLARPFQLNRTLTWQDVYNEESDINSNQLYFDLKALNLSNLDRRLRTLEARLGILIDDLNN